MIIGFFAWFLVGAIFGLLRARAEYHDHIAAFPGLYAQNPGAIKRDAAIDAAVTFVRWTFLGGAAALAYATWVLARRKTQEQPKR